MLWPAVLAAAVCRGERGGSGWVLSVVSRPRERSHLTPHTSQRPATMKVLKKIKARIGLSHKQAGYSPPAQPLEFHPVHGDNVMLSANNTIAAR